MVWELIKSLIFGIVEGITEWLPISSTGHLILLDEFLKLDATDNFKEMFDVVIQLGAILAVVVIYWKKLWPFGKQDNPHPMAQTGFGACLKKDILQMWCKVIVATVNDEDMIAALESGKVAYYCTDFPNAKTCNAKHIIATPHLGASTPESEDNCASMAADELMAYLEQGDIRNSVNLPNAQLQAVYTKVCVIHRNVPAMISALTSVIGEAGANIENMTNASKKDYAYTILDIDGVTDGMIEALTAIDGVLRVRVIEK